MNFDLEACFWSIAPLKAANRIAAHSDPEISGSESICGHLTHFIIFGNWMSWWQVATIKAASVFSFEPIDFIWKSFKTVVTVTRFVTGWMPVRTERPYFFYFYDNDLKKATYVSQSISSPLASPLGVGSTSFVLLLQIKGNFLLHWGSKYQLSSLSG